MRSPYTERSLMPETHPFLGQTRPMFFLDVETDGLRPDAQVWDIGFVRADSSGNLEKFQCYLDIAVMLADPMALDIGQFWHRAPQSPLVTTHLNEKGHKNLSAMLPSEAARKVFTSAHGATLAGIVPSADAQWVGNWLASYGYPIPWHYKFFDVHTYACGVLSLLRDDDTTQWTTEQVSEALNLSIPDQVRHTGLGDAELAFQMYVAARTLVSSVTRCK